MKSRQIYAVMALLLVISLVISAIMAAPAGANSGTTRYVVPFTFSTIPDGTAQWTTVPYSGSYAVQLVTTAEGEYAGFGFTPVSGLGGYDGNIDSVASLSFWFWCTAWDNYAGPRFSLLLDQSGDGLADHLVVGADVAGGTGDWTQWSPSFGDNTGANRFWYGTCDQYGGSYSQEAGPVSFNEVKTHFNGADVLSMAIYMGVVTSGYVGAGSAYVDDPAVNGVTCYGMIQDAIDAALEGDTIVVYPGTYYESIKIDHSLTVQSSGDVLNTTIMGDGTTHAVSIDPFDSAFVGTAVLQGFSIDGNSTTYNAVDVWGIEQGGDVTIRDNIIGNGCNGIHVGGVDAASSITIEDNSIGENDNDGINFGTGAAPMDGNAAIRGNRIGEFLYFHFEAETCSVDYYVEENPNGGDGIEMYAVGANGIATIEYNEIAGNGGIDGGDGIYIGWVDGNVDIIGNDIGAWAYYFHYLRENGDYCEIEVQVICDLGNAGDGVEIYEVAQGGRVNIEDNNIAENGGDGVVFSGPRTIYGDVIIYDNRIGSWTSYGFSGNTTFAGNLEDGIKIASAIEDTGSVRIEGNRISDNGAILSGIHISGVVYGVLDILDNVIGYWEDGLGGEHYGNGGGGIWIERVDMGIYSSATTIGNNTIIDNQGDGVYIGSIGSGSWDSAISVIIEDNIIIENWIDGVYIGNATCAAVVGICQNVIIGHDTGVDLGNGTCGVDVTCNVIGSNGEGIWIDGDFNTIMGNDIFSNTGGLFCGIHLTSDANGNEIHYNNIYDNSADLGGGQYSYGVYKDGGEQVDATDNWWGNATGPGAAGPGDGDWINDYVMYDPWLTAVSQTCWEGDDNLPTIIHAAASPSMVSLWWDDMITQGVPPYEAYTFGPSCYTIFHVTAYDVGSGVATVTVDLRNLMFDLIPEEALSQYVEQLDGEGLAEWNEALGELQEMPLQYDPELGCWYFDFIDMPMLCMLPAMPFGFFALEFGWTEEQLFTVMGEIMGQELQLGQFYVEVTVTDYKGNSEIAYIPIAIVDYQLPVCEGWSLRSTWIALGNNTWQDIVDLDDGLDANSILRWNGEQQRWEQFGYGASGYGWYNGSTYVAPSLMEPLEAYWIHGVVNDQIGLIADRGLTSPPCCPVYAGWNLTSAALPWDLVEKPVDEVLISIYEAAGNTTGYTQVVSIGQSCGWMEYYDFCNCEPPCYWGDYTKWFGQSSWVYTRAQFLLGALIIDGVPMMTRGGGYWVYMENDDELAGFSTTPLPWDFWYLWAMGMSP